MRLAVVPASLALLAAAACGSGSGTSSRLDSLSPAAAVRGAADRAAAGSSKLDLAIESKAQGQDVTFSGTGAFRYAGGSSAAGTMMLTVGGQQLEERIVGGNLYLKVPGQAGFYKLPMKELTGTQLSESSDPASAAKVLAAIGDDVTKVGTETVHGVRTTHYRGTVDVAASAAKLSDSFAKAAIDKLEASGVRKLPVDVYLDDQGRLRRLTEHVTVTVKGVQDDVTTRIDLYDFGTKVDVQVPPADQVKDGAALLSALRAQLGSS
jgi:hypothetical protein